MTITINGNGTVTGISVGGLPDGIVDNDMLASNAATKIIQIQTASQQGVHNTTSTDFTNTNIVDSITPSSASHYIFGTAQAMVLFTNPTNGEAQWRVTREISGGSQTALDTEVWSGLAHSGGAGHGGQAFMPMTFSWCDHPNTTSAVEYRLQNRTTSSSSTVYTYRLQYITLMEAIVG